MNSLSELPTNLPAPVADGACDHLVGLKLLCLDLPTTDGNWVSFSNYPGRLVIYLYPMTGHANRTLPDGWDEIPGVRGWTPEA